MTASNLVVFGLSGVGKSRLITGLTAARSDLLHVQAGQLLREAKEGETARAIDVDELRRDKVIDNQALLLRAFAELRQFETRHILFDGHNVVDTPNGLQEIPFEVIENLSPVALIVVVDDPAAIAERRRADTSRARPDRLPAELETHQDTAFRLAQSAADRLSVPLYQVRSGDGDTFASLAEKHLAEVNRTPPSD